MDGYIALYFYFVIGMANCNSLWKTIFHLNDDNSLVKYKDTPQRVRRLYENQHKFDTSSYNMMPNTNIDNNFIISQKFIKPYRSFIPLHVKTKRKVQYIDDSEERNIKNRNYKGGKRDKKKILDVPDSDNHNHKIQSIFEDEINLKQRAIPRSFIDFKDTLSNENKKSDVIPEDIVLLGGKLDGSGKWWYHEQPGDEKDIPDWVKNDIKEQSTNAYLLIARQQEPYVRARVKPKSYSRIRQLKQQQKVKPHEYFFLPDYSYTENSHPYYIGFNSKSGEFVIVAHSIDQPQQLIRYYNISVNINSNFKTDLHSTRFQPFSPYRIHTGQIDNYRKYMNKVIDKTFKIPLNIPLDDGIRSIDKYIAQQAEGAQENKIPTNPITNIKESKVPNNKNQILVERTNKQKNSSLPTVIIKTHSVHRLKPNIQTNKPRKSHRHKRNINGDNTLKPILDTPFRNDMKSRSVTKEAPPYQKDSRYGIFQGTDSYGQIYKIQRPDINKRFEQQGYLQNSADDRNRYTQENVQMWPRANAHEILNQANNQQYLSNQDTSYLQVQANQFVQDNQHAAGPASYKQNPISSVYQNSPSIKWDPLSPEYRETSYSTNNNDAREPEQDSEYTEPGETYEDNLGRNSYYRNMLGVEKYARVGNDGYGKAGYGHNDHYGYGQKHHSSYGHHDKGYGHDDHKSYDHDDHGYGHDDHKGYGHDNKGYGHDDHKGYGHDDHKGYGHDDYGHDHHGGYHKPSKTKKWDKGYHSKGYGKWGQTGNSGAEHHHNKKGHWNEDHEDHHKSKGTKIKTYSYGGKGWYKEESHGQEKGFGGKKGYHKHSDWGYDKSKSEDKKKPYHEYNTKLNGYHRDYGYHK